MIIWMKIMTSAEFWDLLHYFKYLEFGEFRLYRNRFYCGTTYSIEFKNNIICSVHQPGIHQDLEIWVSQKYKEIREELIEELLRRKQIRDIKEKQKQNNLVCEMSNALAEMKC